ncbi:MAG: response regulator transcription factor, partial [Campylobacteraceae bacterium]|nr:response regulator transcription factor [Campylobacteraceae bacterium]
PDVIVTDISMPIKDGLEFAREVKTISKEIPIIVLSAFSDKDKLIGAIDVGIDKYLIKPIDPEDILNTIHNVTKDRFSVDNIIELGNGYKFDKYKKVLVRNEENINLTKKEILFVSHLIKHLGSFVLHEDIKRIVWSNSKANDTAVRTLVRRVRKKTDPDFIKNVPGLGYKIDS